MDYDYNITNYEELIIRGWAKLSSLIKSTIITYTLFTTAILPTDGYYITDHCCYIYINILYVHMNMIIRIDRRLYNVTLKSS